MADLSINDTLLALISTHLERAAEKLSFARNVRDPGGAGLHAAIPEEALADAARQHTARAEILQELLRELAAHPTTVAERFEQQDRVLGEAS